LKNKNNDLLHLEARFQKKLDWMFYIIMAVILMVIVSNFYVLKDLTHFINDALEFKPQKSNKQPLIRSA
jgi:uncharacterized membrane protein